MQTESVDHQANKTRPRKQHMYSHLVEISSLHRQITNHDLLSGSFRIPSTSNLRLASSSAHVCIL